MSTRPGSIRNYDLMFLPAMHITTKGSDRDALSKVGSSKRKAAPVHTQKPIASPKRQEAPRKEVKPASSKKRKLADVEPQDDFEWKVNSILEREGKMFRAPMISHERLSILALKKEVEARGGLASVCHGQKWRAVAVATGMPLSCTNLSFRLKTAYEKYICPITGEAPVVTTPMKGE
uniref:ARID domain-containing protein n=1 Tax=Palpitomonas bilix TaxID=652834 RepID=A0A7S3D457_9EUKA|mmetsp:Transcript_21336/g.55455  ORF Transcript_21336/g.55455 Transcript_21336/m.55455 type:complete len:177 (+) Transcript_21336:86-616(+)